MKAGRIVSFAVMGLLVAVVMTLNIACAIYADAINFYLVGFGSDTSQQQLDATARANAELAERIMGEGIVMVKNDSALPLQSSTRRVNVFGWASTQWVPGGSGSGRVVTSGDNSTDGLPKLEAQVGLLEALSQYGISHNTQLTNMYRDYLDHRPFWNDGTLNTYEHQFYRLYEPSINDRGWYSQAMLSSAQNYSDTALVVIGRVAGESSDAPQVQYKGTSNSATSSDSSRTYLDISTEEEALLEYVGANFARVIVIINSTNTLNLGWLDTIPGLDACLIVGGTGMRAATAIPKVLWGQITPSGRTVDTWVRDFASSPAFGFSAMEGSRFYANGSGLYPANGTTNSNYPDKPAYAGVAYVDYVEGIYVGYKWYETAFATGFYADYASVVQFPFGFGLSYTNFEWRVASLSHADGATLGVNDTITVAVRVTNVGKTHGQDVVQLYYTPPYTVGGIEKSAVNLAAYAKTEVLEPGQSQTLTLSLDVRDMASYDCYDLNVNGHATFELDGGDYQLRLMRDAHNPMPISPGAVHNDSTITLSVPAGGYICDTDPVSGLTISNKFTGSSAIDGVALDGSDSNANITFLSRADFAGTFVTTAGQRDMSQSVIDQNSYTQEMALAFNDPNDPPIVTSTYRGMMLFEDGKPTELGLELGADWDDPRWEDVLDQTRTSELVNLALHGYVRTGAINSIGKPATLDADGPSQIGSFNMPRRGTAFPMPTVLAQTFSPLLAYNYGLALGREAAELGFDGWYGPGVNIHRTPFGGRNYEYFSEDAFLTGAIAANIIRAARNCGVYSYVKHLALYDQEAHRDGLYTWLSEQTLREIYLRPFQMAVHDGGATGIMTAYNRIGAVWSGGSTALISGIVRDEWGFRGAVLTDYADHHSYMNMDQALRAGGDLWMDGWNNNGKFRFTSEEAFSNSFFQALRRAAKNVTYMQLNALWTNHNYNADADNEKIVKATRIQNFPWWIPVLVGINVVIFGGCGAWSYLLLRKKSQAPDASDMIQ